MAQRRIPSTPPFFLKLLNSRLRNFLSLISMVFFSFFPVDVDAGFWQLWSLGFILFLLPLRVVVRSLRSGRVSLSYCCSDVPATPLFRTLRFLGPFFSNWCL